MMHYAFNFLCGFDLKARAWAKRGAFSAEDKDHLTAAIHQTANHLTLLAQEIDDPNSDDGLDIPAFLRREHPSADGTIAEGEPPTCSTASSSPRTLGVHGS